MIRAMIHALLVDDDPELRALVTDYLHRYGIRMTPLANGQELRRVLPSGGPRSGDPFDVLPVDLMLPDIGGLELCR